MLFSRHSQIQSIPTVWTYVTDALRVPVFPEPGTGRVALQTGLLFIVVVPGGTFSDQVGADAVALVAGVCQETTVILAPITELATHGVALQTGLLFLVIVPGGIFSDQVASHAVALAAGALVVIVISGGSFSDNAHLSVALQSGALV